MNLYGLLDAIIGKVNRSVKVDTQELGETLQKQARDNIGAVGKEEVCNPNLLDNWYFGKPINQRGQAEYRGNQYGYTLDRWDVQHAVDVLVNDGYVAIHKIDGTYGRIRQFLDMDLLDKEVTFSILMLDNTLYSFTTIVPSGEMNYFNIYGNAYYGIRLNTDKACTELELFFNSVATNSLNIVALKLEIGDTQTLARQDSNGNWVLNEIPKYEEELLKCRQYDSSTGEYIGLRKFSQPRNLLDNSDFSKPINQRGFVSGTMGTATYSIDRWWLQYSTNLYLSDDCIGLNGYWDLRQPIGTKIKAGQKYTVAVYAKGEAGSEKMYLYFGTSDGTIGQSIREQNLGTKWNLYLFTWTADKDYEPGGIMFILGTGADGTEQTTQTFYKCPVLYEGEYTIDTLPEYTPKGYGTELAECMRYYIASPNDSTWSVLHNVKSGYLMIAIPTPVQMRISPSIVPHNSGFRIYNGSWTNLDITQFAVMNHNGYIVLQAKTSLFSDISFTEGMSYLINYLPSFSADL